jgi:hypothetical protein
MAITYAKQFYTKRELDIYDDNILIYLCLLPISSSFAFGCKTEPMSLRDRLQLFFPSVDLESR